MELWVEKYRPTTLETYIGNETIKSKIEDYLKQGSIQNLLLHGVAGTGKTTLAKLLVKNIPELRWQERVVCVIIWPLTLIVFIYSYLKSFFK